MHLAAISTILKSASVQLKHARCSSAVAAMKQVVGDELNSIRDAGTWKHERVITTPQGAQIKVKGQGKEILNFCANNYLGLSVSYNHPVLFFIILYIVMHCSGNSFCFFDSFM